MLNYAATAAPQGACACGGTQASGLNLNTLLPAQIGRDTTNVFAFTPFGIAIQRPDGRYIMRDPGSDALQDVTLFALPGVDPMAFRVPVETSQLRRGDLIVRSDYPLSFLYVIENHPRHLIGLDPVTGERVQFLTPENPFFDISVRVVSVLDAFLSEPEEQG